MIDKVSLHTQYFEVVKNNFRVKQPTIDYSTGESLNDFILFRCNGEDVNGSSAFINDKDFAVNVNVNGLQILFNPAKVYHGNNYYSVDYHQNNEVLKGISKKVRDYGIALDFNRLTLKRLDLQKTIATDYSFVNYNQVFNHLSLSRTHEIDYGDGYAFRNGNKEVVFYDKKQEMLSRKGKNKVNLSAIPNLPDNVLRCEFRAKDSKLIRKDLGIHNIKEFNTKDCYHNLHNVYNHIINDDLFQSIPKGELVVNYDKEIDFLKGLKSKYKRSAIDAYLKTFLFEYNPITPEQLKVILLQADYHRSTVKRTLDKLYALQKYNVLERSQRKVEVYQLGEELRTKLSA